MRRLGLATALALVAGVLALTAPPASAGVIINVPASQPTIQAGIDAAANGDMVVVAPGTYFEHIDFKGKAIEVRSSAGPATTIINGGGTDHVVTFKTNETPASILKGFSVTNGGMVSWGLGIFVDHASPTIVGNVVAGNNGQPQDGGGMGIAILNGSPVIKGNQILDNPGGGSGGGIYAIDGTPEIVGNLVQGHTASFGAGILLESGTLRDNVIRGNHASSSAGGVLAGGPLSMTNNLIVDNSAVIGGGMTWGSSATTPSTLVNNTFVGNEGETGSALYVDEAGLTLINNVLSGDATGGVVSCWGFAPGRVVFSHNDVYNGTASPFAGCANQTGTNGNISADPLFDANYRLLVGSPAMDAGAAGPSVPTNDPAGNPRPMDGNGDGVAVVDMGAFESPAVPVPTYHPLTPARILDTRTGNGAPATRVEPEGLVALQVTGRGGVPASGVSAVVLNVTVTEPTAVSFLTAWPAGTSRPLTSNLNYAAGQTVANLVTVKVGTDGKVNLLNYAGSTHVIADVAGWYGGGGDGFNPLSPSRILDTRNGGGPLAPGTALTLQVTGQGGVPASGVSAVVLNLTVTNTGSGGWLAAWPAGEALPLVSNLNYVPGQTVPNLAIVKVGTGGAVNLYSSGGPVDVIADVAGYFSDAGAGFAGLPSARILDTRTGVGPLAPGTARTLQVTGQGGVPATGVSAVVLNLTVTNTGSGGWLAAWPAGEALPLVSNLNYVPGQTVPNLAIVKVGTGGAVNLYSSGGPVDVIADVAGWFTA